MSVLSSLKVCCRCRKEKKLEDFWVDSRKQDGKREACAECLREAYRIRYAKYPEKYRNQSKSNRKKFKEKVEKYHKEWTSKNKNKVIGYKKKSAEKIKTEAYDSYVKGIIALTTGAKREDIPIMLIELVRTNLILKRAINEAKNEKR